jgi:hypothetical protein
MTALTQSDLEGFAKLSIPPALLDQAGIVRVTDKEARDHYGVKGGGDMAGIAFPYFDPETMSNGRRRTYVRIRRDHPEIEDGKAKRKYIAPFGDRKRLYFPPTPELFANATVPIVLVEAEKSSLALTAWAARTGRKILPIAMGGCYGWCGKTGIKETPTGERVPETGAIRDLNICREGRYTYVLLDANCSTNFKVQMARRDLVKQLRKQGANVRILDLPTGEGINGPDDYIGAMSDDALTRLFEGAGREDADDKPIRQFDQIPDLMTMEIPPVDPLVNGMIARKTITLWTGSDGTVKTFLLQKMAIAVATGGQFLGRSCQRAPVLYLDYENPSFAVRDRFELMAGGPIASLKVWGTWLKQQPPQISNELLLTIARETKPLIIIDPFRYAHGEDENNSTEMMGVMQMLRYCAAAGGAVIIVHHPAKAEGSLGRGSSAIKGAVDVAFLQELSSDTGLITLRCNKNRFGEQSVVTIRPDYGLGTFEVADSPQFVRCSNDSERLKRIITDKPGQSQNTICESAGGMKSKVIQLLKDGRNIHWTSAPGPNNSKQYFPLGWFSKFRTTDRTTEPHDEPGDLVSGSVVLSPKGENHQNHHHPQVFSGSSLPKQSSVEVTDQEGAEALRQGEEGQESPNEDADTAKLPVAMAATKEGGYFEASLSSGATKASKRTLRGEL